MKKLIIRLALALVVVVIIGLIAAFIFLNSIVKKGVETVGPQITKVDVKVDDVNLSVFSGSGSIKGLLVGNPEGYKTPQAIRVGNASLAVSPGTLLSDKIVVKSIRVDAAEVTFEGGLTGNNLSQILDNVNASADTKEETTPTEEQASTKKLQVDDFLITGAKVHVSLTGMGGKSVTVPLPDIHLTNLGQGEDGITAADLTKRVLGEIVRVATQVVSSDAVKDLTKGITDAAGQAGKAATDAAGKATKSVTDLFKKKE